MLCEEKFYELYRKAPEAVAFCPYRICPIGAHSDHNLGKITGLAIDKGIFVAYKPKQNGVVELCSLQFEKRAQWHVRDVPERRQGDWADYLRGVTKELAARYPLGVGLSAVIEGTLPIGGLSSSAAVCISFLSALCRVNGLTLEPAEAIQIALLAENRYVGVSCGKLDQSCEVYGRKDRLLYLDTKDDSYELIAPGPGMKPYDILIFFSGVERNLATSAFNMRVDELRSAAYALKAYAGLPYGKFGETHMREVPRAVYEEYRGRLPEPWRRRADHWFSEFARVEAGAEAWRRGDIVEYGRLSFESGRSSIYDWETGSPELKTLYDIMTRTEGIYGGRFSGAGFKGCCMALADPAFRESILEKVETEYLQAFPALRGAYRAEVCRSADGVIF
ncbi:MAG: galactokinase [Bacteroidales bacterium]|nr:galactokinase [Bacteroidales bacterium]MBP5390436.1 galactokinase [Bacteroidales bacterium]MBP5635727.1 galactokinase [Bacteroidales bacterium]